MSDEITTPQPIRDVRAGLPLLIQGAGPVAGRHGGPLEARALHATIKVMSRCNLNCSYCYVYNQADTTWTTRPSLLSDAVLEATIRRLRRHCERSGQPVLRLVLHGGEPLLVGPERFDRWCQALWEGLADMVELHLTVQTNATLIDERWTEVFRKHRIIVGVSLDGPAEVHDARRVDHQGRGSYEQVARGVERLLQADLQVSFLAVIQLGADPLAVHRHLLSLGACQIEYLFPDQTHETIGEVLRRHGPTPCSDFLIPIFDDWWYSGTMDVRVGPFVAIARAILGGPCEVDFIGNNPLGYLFVETDGSIEGLDVLRVCANGMAATGATVHANDFMDVAEISPLHRAMVFEGMPLPTGCVGCPEQHTCAGGYVPHRYSQQRGFDNPSAWCADLLRLFGHLRERLEVSWAETQLRQAALAELAAEARGAGA